MILQISDSLQHFERANWRVYHRNTLKFVRETFAHMKPKKVRPILDFAEAELRYPTGRYKGMPFSRHYQPATSLLLEQMADPHWLHTFVVGPHQAGKSLSITVYAMYVLFELQQDLIYGMPDIAMRAVKFQKDIRPMIINSRFGRFMPSRGAGSQGGVSEIVLFQNGVSLQFMGAGGGDGQRAGATARYLILTEAEKFGVKAAKSEEGSKFQQIIGRVQHFAGEEKVVAESTITTEDGLMWTEFESGSASVVHIQCHSCDKFVAPERDDLVGFDGVKSEAAARSAGGFSCPQCGIVWKEDDRKAMLQTAILLHGNQSTDENGTVTGGEPPTRKLGFRFSAATNAFSSAGSISVEEFNLRRATSPAKKDSLDRALKQFRFAVPVKPGSVEIDPLDGRRLQRRIDTDLPRGFVPAGDVRLRAGVDVRRTQLHWVVLAFTDHGIRFVDWGFEKMPREGVLFEQMLLKHGKILQGKFRDGFPIVDTDKTMPVQLTLCDAGWETWHVQTLTDIDDFWMPTMGFGSGILKSKAYKAPKTTAGQTRIIGDRFHIAEVNERLLCELDANGWKSQLQQLLRIKLENQHALAFPQTDDETGQRELIAHLTSEKEFEKYVGGEVITEFAEPTGENHWLDASVYALAADQVDLMVAELLADKQPEEIEFDPAANGW